MASRLNEEVLEALWEIDKGLYNKLWFDGITAEEMVSTFRAEDPELYEIILWRF